jgi:hypothetical protein
MALFGFVFSAGLDLRIQGTTDHGQKKTAPFYCYHLTIPYP